MQQFAMLVAAVLGSAALVANVPSGAISSKGSPFAAGTVLVAQYEGTCVAAHALDPEFVRGALLALSFEEDPSSTVPTGDPPDYTCSVENDTGPYCSAESSGPVTCTTNGDSQGNAQWCSVRATGGGSANGKRCSVKTNANGLKCSANSASQQNNQDKCSVADAGSSSQESRCSVFDEGLGIVGQCSVIKSDAGNHCSVFGSGVMRCSVDSTAAVGSECSVIPPGSAGTCSAGDYCSIMTAGGGVTKPAGGCKITQE